MYGKHNQKYAYTKADYPTNNGSLKNPGRITIRCNVTQRARWKKALCRIASVYGESAHSLSDVANRHVLKMIEDLSWRDQLARAAKRKAGKRQ